MGNNFIEIEFKENEFEVCRYNNNTEEYDILLYPFYYSSLEDLSIEEFDDYEYGNYVLFDPDTVFPFLVKHLIEENKLKYYIDRSPEVVPYIRKYKKIVTS